VDIFDFNTLLTNFGKWKTNWNYRKILGWLFSLLGL
jgi:hypothetical protein